jgi:hypothetical protein
MAARETKQHKEKKALHKATAAERSAVDKHFARREAKPSVRLKVSKNGSDPQIELDHPDKVVGWALVMEALASADYDFANGIVDQLAKASGRGQDISEHGINFMLSIIKGIEPRDQLETMLAVQMAAVHMSIDKSVLAVAAPRRYRNREHLRYVAPTTPLKNVIFS